MTSHAKESLFKSKNTTLVYKIKFNVNNIMLIKNVILLLHEQRIVFHEW